MRVCKRSVDKVPGAKGLGPGSRRLLAFRAFLFLSTSEAAAVHLHQLIQLVPDTCQGANEFPQACAFEILICNAPPPSIPTSLFS